MRALISALFGFATALSAGNPVNHRFVCVDNGANRLILVDQRNPVRNWSVPIPAGSRDLQRLPGERLLVSHGNGCGVYRLADGATLWKLEGFAGIQTAQVDAERGQLLLGASGKEGYEFSFLPRAGDWFAAQPCRRVLVPGQPPGYLRLARLTEAGHLLFTAGWRVVEWDPATNTEAWSAKLTGKGYVAQRAPGGATFVSTGGAVSVLELSPDGTICRTWAGESVKQSWRLDWFSGFQLLPNHHLVVANWLGHGAWGKGPHLVELDLENHLVWTWEDHHAAKQVTNVLVLDEDFPDAPLNRQSENRTASPSVAPAAGSPQPDHPGAAPR